MRDYKQDEIDYSPYISQFQFVASQLQAEQQGNRCRQVEVYLFLEIWGHICSLFQLHGNSVGVYVNLNKEQYSAFTNATR